jgi:DNA-binding transcriptional LysR family regulator
MVNQMQQYPHMMHQTVAPGGADVTDLEDLRSFVEVVESGGFNRAAERLGISKSMVSRRIARLEAALGARLLSRTTRGISPTEAGLEFKARSERILADLEEAREAVAQQGGGVIPTADEDFHWKSFS